jgi:hypothetical protein
MTLVSLNVACATIDAVAQQKEELNHHEYSKCLDVISDMRFKSLIITQFLHHSDHFRRVVERRWHSRSDS